MTLEFPIPAAPGSRPRTATCLQAGLASALLLALAVACSGGFTSGADLGQGAGAGSTSGGGGTDTQTPSTTGSPTTTTPPSTAPSGDTTCVPLADYFADKMWKPVLSTTCANCHASVPDFTLDPSKDVSVAYQTVVAEAKKNDAGGKSLLTQKPIGEDSHQGMAVFTADSDTYKTFDAFVKAVTGGKDCVANN